MAENRNQLQQHYRQLRAVLLAALDGLSDEAMSDPSLDGWSVKDHLIHLAMWDEIRAAEVRRISAGHQPLWAPGAAQDALYAALCESRRGATLAQARWELESTHVDLLAALDAATEHGLDGSLYSEAGLRSTHEAAHTGWIQRWRTGRRR